jgi:hypothetical protein
MATRSRSEDVLSQFPGPVTLSSSSSPRMKAMALLSVVAAAALIYVGIMDRGLSTGHPQSDLAGAVVMFSFAALSMAVLRRAVIQLRYGSLRLDETGLSSPVTVVSAIFGAMWATFVSSEAVSLKMSGFE